jgi:hypothetical protein
MGGKFLLFLGGDGAAYRCIVFMTPALLLTFKLFSLSNTSDFLA